MWNVVGTLVPIIAAAAWFFGVSALLVIGAAAAGRPASPSAPSARAAALADGSAVITGLLLGLTLPAGLPLWMAFLGGAFGIGFGKLVWGGLGQNVFNPALVGRAFLQAAFPVAITTWPTARRRILGAQGRSVRASRSRIPNPDAITSATPLGLLKFEGKGTELMRPGDRQHRRIAGRDRGARHPRRRRLPRPGSATSTGGSRPASCSRWRRSARRSISSTPRSARRAVHALLGRPDARRGVHGHRHGHRRRSPIAGAGCSAVGIGVLVVVIRIWGGLPEGVMYAILFMNALTPFINRATQPRVFGTGRGWPHDGGAPCARRARRRHAEQEHAGVEAAGDAGAGRRRCPGWLVVSVYQVTLPDDPEATRPRRCEGAVREVLKAPARWDTLYLVNDALTRTRRPRVRTCARCPRRSSASTRSGKRHRRRDHGRGARLPGDSDAHDRASTRRAARSSASRCSTRRRRRASATRSSATPPSCGSSPGACAPLKG